MTLVAPAPITLRAKPSPPAADIATAIQLARGHSFDGSGTLRLGFDQPGQQRVFRRAGTGGQPGMPHTGAGGMAGARVAAGPALLGGVLVLAGGVAVAWRRGRAAR